MNYTIKTYLITLMLISTSLVIYGAELSFTEQMKIARALSAADAREKDHAIALQLDLEEKQRVAIEERMMPVVQQKNSDCGFHAVYNAKYDDGKLSEDFLRIMRRWCVSKTALNQEDIFTLAVQELHMKPTTFTILPNINQLVPDPNGTINSRWLLPILGQNGILARCYAKYGLKEGISILTRVLNNLRSNPSAEHAFILGNTRLLYDASTKTYTGSDAGAHWIAIRARNENGKIVLYIKDSVTGYAGTRDMIESFKKIMRTCNTATLYKQATEKLKLS